LVDGLSPHILDSEVYFPKHWMEDSVRRRAEGIPEWLPYRARWKIVLDLFQRARDRGIQFAWIFLDRAFQGEIETLQALAELNIKYMAEVSEAFPGWLYPPFTRVAGEDPTAGLHSLFGSAGELPRPPHPVRGLIALRTLPNQITLSKRESLHKSEVWQAGIVQFYPASRGLPTSALALLLLRNVPSGQSHFLVSNGCLGSPLQALGVRAVRLIGSRKQLHARMEEAGLMRPKVRGYRLLKRHLVLLAIRTRFISEQAKGPRRPTDRA
jgi:hypothetical protein